MSPAPSSAAYAVVDPTLADQRALRAEEIVPHPECVEVFAHEVHHGVDGEAADLRQPDRFRLFQPAPAVAGGERLAHWHR